MNQPSSSDGWPTEPPAWLGDIAAGVDAWTQRADESSAEPKRSFGSTESGDGSRPRPRRSASGRGRSASSSAKRPRRELTDEEFAAKEARAIAREERRSQARDAPQGSELDGDAARPRTRRVRDEGDPEERARKIILDQLTGAARSRADLRKKLDAKEIPEEVSEQLLDRFTEVGLIDDRTFARNWAEGRQRAKGLAPRAIQQELRRKGIDDEFAAEALEALDHESQVEAATELVRKKIRSLRRFDRTVATRRLVAMLARKGYGGDIAWPVVKAELDTAEFATSAATDAEDDEPSF